MNIWTLRSRWPKDFHKIRKIAHNYETCFCSSHSLEFLGREKFTAVCAWHARFFLHCISKSKILAVYYFLPKVEKSYSKYQKHFFQAKKVAIAKKKKRFAIYFWKNNFFYPKNGVDWLVWFMSTTSPDFQSSSLKHIPKISKIHFLPLLEQKWDHQKVMIWRFSLVFKLENSFRLSACAAACHDGQVRLALCQE